MRKPTALLLLPWLALTASAQGPNDTGTYYQDANGKKGADLKTALYNIISPHTNVGYDGLWDVFSLSDLREDGTYWDMYSATSAFKPGASSSYSKEGDGINREHTVPQSWFSSAAPMKSDAFHVIPTDGYVNGRRSNYPYGEVSEPTYTSNEGFSKVGPCSTDGYDGTVFEPNDEYKGDLARGYFYMATCYEDKAGSWGGVFGEGTYPSIQEWQLTMLLRWAKDDPVSRKEVDRNEAIYSFQSNRNPFIDYPGLEQFVWGDSVDVAFDYESYAIVEDSDTTDTTTPDEPDQPTVPETSTTDSTYLFYKVTSASQVQTGCSYLLVYESGSKAMGKRSGSNNDVREGVDVTIDNNQISTAVNTDGKPRVITLGGEEGAYLLAVEGDSLLGLGSNANKLHTMSPATSSDNVLWTITISDGNAVISNNAYSTRQIQWNASAPRFATYTGTQQDVQLYLLDDTADGVQCIEDDVLTPEGSIFTLQGQRLGRVTRQGLYIVDGKKTFIR